VGDGEFGPISSLLTPYRPQWVCASLAPRFGPNSTRHAAYADFSDSLLEQVPPLLLPLFTDGDIRFPCAGFFSGFFW